MTTNVTATSAFFKWADTQADSLKLALASLPPSKESDYKKTVLLSQLASLKDKQKLAKALQGVTRATPVVSQGGYPEVIVTCAKPESFAAETQGKFEKLGFVFEVTGRKATYGKISKFLGIKNLRLSIKMVSSSQVSIRFAIQIYGDGNYGESLSRHKTR